MNRNRSKNIIYSIIILMVCFYAFLTGCGGSSGKNPTLVYYNDDSNGSATPLSKDLTISQDGRLAKTTSPTGLLVLEAPEENTYNSEVVLRITESPSVGNETSLLTIGSKIYGITATRDGQPVNILSHPLILTFANEEKLQGAENYYIGMKEIGDEAWQFVNVYSTNASIRTSISSANEFRYSIYKNNILIALFSDIHKSLQFIPQVQDLTATLTPSIVPAKNSVYTNNLRVNMQLRGDNLSNITVDNFKVKVAYLTSNSQSTSLKVDDRTVNYLNTNTSNRYEAFGEGYARYFQFTPLSTKYSSGFAPNIFFDINLKDLPVSDFSTDFIVEISNTDSRILPFAYSSILHFEKSDSGSDTDTNTNTNTNTDTNTSTDTDTGTNTSTDTNTGTNTSTDPQQPKAKVNLKSPEQDFPVTGSKLELEFSKDITWNITENSKITIDNDAVINGWSYSDKVLSLSFKDKLAYNTTYIVKVTDMTDVENATLVFKTESIGTVALKSAATDFQVSNSNIELEFSKEIPWTMADRAKIAIDNSVEVSDYTYANKVLTLSLRKKLRFANTYLITVSGLECIENNTLVLKTESNAEATLKSASEDFSVNSPIEIEFSKDIYFENEDITNISIDNNAEIDQCSYANKILNIKVKGKLNYDTLYTITFNGVNGVVNAKSLSLKTEKINARPVISLAEDSIMPNMNGRTALKPKFYIDFGKPIASKTLVLSNIKLNGANLPEGSSLDFDANMQNVAINFANDLEEAIDYTLSIKEYTDEDNGIINSTEFAFRTKPSDNLPGSGTIDDPFLVYHQNHLKQLANTTPINYLQGKYFFKQIDDITLVGEWDPIGKNIGPFTGNYDGNDRTISNLKISNGNSSFCAALFNSMDRSSISNLTLRNADIFGQDNSAFLCGYIENSIIENIKVEGNISIETPWENNPIGVIGGYSYNTTFRDVSVTGVVNLSKNENYAGGYHGGLIGYCVKCNFSNCCVDSPEGIIKGRYNTGGLIGGSDNDTTINNCYTRTNLKVYDQAVGGLIGQCGSVVNNSYSDCQITTTQNSLTYAGGLIGRAYEGCKITNCYASGSLLLDTDYANYVGVFIGELSLAEVNNSFSTVKINVGESYVYNGNDDCYNPEDSSGTPLWHKVDYTIPINMYIYNTDGTNYFGTGYDPSILNWNTAYWFNLSDGSFPKLIGLPNW